MVASPAVQPEPGMAPLDLQQATLPSQPIAREAIPAAQPVQTQGQSAPSPQADAQAEALAQAIQGQPSSSLTSPATMTYRQAAQEEGSRTGARQAKKARPPQAAGQPPMDVPPQEKAGAAQRAQGASQARPKATAAEEKQAREQQPPAGQDKDIASYFAPAQPAAEGEGLQPERADGQPVMAQRALGQEAAPGPVGAALQYAPIPEPGQARSPGHLFGRGRLGNRKGPRPKPGKSKGRRKPRRQGRRPGKRPNRKRSASSKGKQSRLSKKR